MRNDSLKRWAIIGAGPVGLTLALQVARLMELYGWDSEEASVTVFETRMEKDGDGHWKRTGRRRGQVVTLQDDVINLFKDHYQELHDVFAGERVWPNSRNCAILDLEDRLLALAQDGQGSRSYIRLSKPPTAARATHAQWTQFLLGLDADIIVAADGAASLTREALWPPRTVLGETEPEMLVEADYALGVGLLGDTSIPQDQSLNVVLTLSQTRYLLNSERGMRGYLNIRITKEEYDQVFEATGKKGCSFGSPIALFNPFKPLPKGVKMLKERQEWLEATVRDGLTLFGLTEYHIEDIVGIQLRPAYVVDFFGILNSSHNKPKPLILIGDAAISHHFWPGRGLNTGLKAAAAISLMWSGGGGAAPKWNSIAGALALFQSFMTALREREMQGRSRSMLMKENQLPEWIPGELNGLSSDRLNKCEDDKAENEAALLAAAKGWRNSLERRGPAWPHPESLTDDKLQEKICKTTVRPGPVTTAIMKESATQGKRLSGWPVDQQGGNEVDPKDSASWPWSRPYSVHLLEHLDDSENHSAALRVLGDLAQQGDEALAGGLAAPVDPAITSSITSAVRNRLEDESESVRLLALWRIEALAERSAAPVDPAITSAVVNRLKDEDVHVRRKALEALKAIAERLAAPVDPAITSAVRNRLGGESAWVRSAALRTLKALERRSG